MKSVLIIASTLMALSAEGKTTGPADSLKISKDISLDEVVVTANMVTREADRFVVNVAATPLSAGKTGE